MQCADARMLDIFTRAYMNFVSPLACRVISELA